MKYSNILVLAIPQVLNVFSQVLFNVLVLIKLPITSIGEYRIYTLSAAYLSFTGLGFFSGAVQKISDFSDFLTDKKSVETNVFLFGLINGVINSVLVAVFFANSLSYDYKILLYTTCFLMPIISSFDVILKYHQDFRSINVNVFIELFISAGIIGTLYFEDFNPKFFVYSLILKFCIIGFVRFRFFKISYLLGSSVSKKFIFVCTKSGLTIMLSGYLLNSVFLNWDQYTVAKLYGKSTLGLYSLQIFISGFVISLIGSIDSVIYPKSLANLSVSEFTNIKKVYVKNMILLSIMIVLFSILVYNMRYIIYDIRQEYSALDSLTVITLVLLPINVLFALTSFFAVLRNINYLIVITSLFTFILYSYTFWSSGDCKMSMQEIVLCKYFAMLFFFLLLLAKFIRSDMNFVRKNEF